MLFEGVMYEVIRNEQATKVFLDADVFIGLGKPPGNWLFKRLEDLVNLSLISIVTTDVTIGEVVKHHVKDSFEALGPIRDSHFREVVTDVLGIELPNKRNTEWRSYLRELYEEGIPKMFAKLNAQTIPLDCISPSVIFRDYIECSGFFDPGNKPNQFADAFVFAAITDNLTNDEQLIVVARDKDFDDPVSDHPDTILLKSIEELFERFAVKVESPNVSEIEEFLEYELITNESFLYHIELTDFEIDDDWKFDAEVRDISIEVVSAFGLSNEDMVLAKVNAKVDLDLDYQEIDRYKGEYENELFQASETAEVELIVALSQEEGIPRAIEQVKMRKYFLPLEQGYSSTVSIDFVFPY